MTTPTTTRPAPSTPPVSTPPAPAAATPVPTRPAPTRAGHPRPHPAPARPAVRVRGAAAAAAVGPSGAARRHRTFSPRWPGGSTGRDRWLLAMLAEHRVLTTAHLAALGFAGRRQAERRLAQLWAWRCVDRFRPFTPLGGGSAPYHWVLDDAGAAVLAAGHGIELRDLGYSRAAALAVAHSEHLAHTLGTNTLLTALAASGGQDGADAAAVAAGRLVGGTPLRRDLGRPGPPRRRRHLDRTRRTPSPPRPQPSAGQRGHGRRGQDGVRGRVRHRVRAPAAGGGEAGRLRRPRRQHRRRAAGAVLAALPRPRDRPAPPPRRRPGCWSPPPPPTTPPTPAAPPARCGGRPAPGPGVQARRRARVNLDQLTADWAATGTLPVAAGRSRAGLAAPDPRPHPRPAEPTRRRPTPMSAMGRLIAAAVTALVVPVLLLSAAAAGSRRRPTGPRWLERQGSPARIPTRSPTSRPTCSRSTSGRRPPTATGCPGPCWPRSARSSPTTAGPPSPASTVERTPPGAQGPMQFLPATFAAYSRPVPPGGANPPSPYDPVDAVHAAARYLCASGARAGPDIRRRDLALQPLRRLRAPRPRHRPRLRGGRSPGRRRRRRRQGRRLRPPASSACPTSGAATARPRAASTAPD